jgi:hypothetical protein
VLHEVDWLAHFFRPGVAVTILAFAAAVMASREKWAKAIKVLWLVLFGLLAAAEISVTTNDRMKQDESAAKDRQDQQLRFHETIDKLQAAVVGVGTAISQQNVTLNKLDITTRKLDKTARKIDLSIAQERNHFDSSFSRMIEVPNGPADAVTRADSLG